MTATPADEFRLQMEYENRVLELVENQLRNDDDSLTQSDLQGAVGAIIMSAIRTGKEIQKSVDGVK